MDYAKIDRIVGQYHRTQNQAEYLASVWMDLTRTEGRAVLEGIDAAKREDEHNAQYQGGMYQTR